MIDSVVQLGMENIIHMWYFDRVFMKIGLIFAWSTIVQDIAIKNIQR